MICLNIASRNEKYMKNLYSENKLGVEIKPWYVRSLTMVCVGLTILCGKINNGVLENKPLC